MCIHLLIGKDEQHCILQLVLVEHPMQLVSRLRNTVSIVTVYDEDQGLGVHVIVAPEWSDPILATDVPDGEIDVFVLDSLNIETDCRYCGHVFPQLQLV